MQRLIDRADSDKLKKARERLARAGAEGAAEEAGFPLSLFQHLDFVQHHEV